MFKFGKKKITHEELIMPVDGSLIAIEDVKDPVFSEKMMGDGFAITATGYQVFACGDGVITMLFPSNHAVGLTLDSGMEVLIHVGIDTVNENGTGFVCSYKQGDRVMKGQHLLSFDRTYLESKGYDLTIIVIFTNKETYANFHLASSEKLVGGKDIAVNYTI